MNIFNMYKLAATLIFILLLIAVFTLIGYKQYKKGFEAGKSESFKSQQAAITEQLSRCGDHNGWILKIEWGNMVFKI